MFILCMYIYIYITFRHFPFHWTCVQWFPFVQFVDTFPYSHDPNKACLQHNPQKDFGRKYFRYNRAYGPNKHDITCNAFNSLWSGSFDYDFECVIFTQWLMSPTFPVELSSVKCHRNMLMISPHLFWYCFGIVKQQGISGTNPDKDPWRHMASLGQCFK